MYDIKQYVFDFVESIKEREWYDSGKAEDKYDINFQCFDDTTIWLTLITHHGMPFKISNAYLAENDNETFDDDFIKEFINSVNSLL